MSTTAGRNDRSPYTADVFVSGIFVMKGKLYAHRTLKIHLNLISASRNVYPA